MFLISNYLLDCCGEEVTSDYPHNEVQNKGVNHFPDGVFQRCRKIVQQEKEAERERLRKIRRMKTKVVPFGQQEQPAGATAISVTSTANVGMSSSSIAGSGNTRNFAITAPSSGNTNFEAMWLLERQYDIEPLSTPVGSPSRPASRSVASTPAPTVGMMTPSPARVVPTAASDISGNGNGSDGLDSPGAVGSARVRTAGGSSRNSSSRGRVVPVNGTVSASTTAGSNNISTNNNNNGSSGIAARPFPMLEQQVLYQHQVLMANRSGATSIHGSASSPQLLLGSPLQQQRNRAARP